MPKRSHSSSPLGLLRRFTVAALAVLAAIPFDGAAVHAQTQAPTAITPQAQVELRAGDMVVPLNKSQVLRLERPFTDLSVGNAEIADVVALSDRSVYVLGKSLGATNLSIYGRNRQLLAVVDIVVTHDVQGLKDKLAELLPTESVEVRPAGDSVVLSGTVSNPDRLASAVAVSERYAPGKVTNLLRVAGSQQVMLAVRIAEVSRTTARELGIKPDFTLGQNDTFSFTTLDGLDITRFGAGLAHWTAGFFTMDLLIDALEQKGVVKVLAEPNLIALSGDTANFLAGGEFPVPVAQDNNGDRSTITVEFKQFGVGLAFTPTVLDGDLINLVVSPEVSQIDDSNAVVLSGFRIPGLSTRRATTTVELRDGQSFAIAGLLQNDFQDQIRQVPGVGQVPVLGALFRSAEFQRRESELVIIVTPRLVKPVAAGSLRTPVDHFVPPSDLDLFLLGRTEAPGSGVAPGEARAVLGAQAGGGIAGTYGHIIK